MKVVSETDPSTVTDVICDMCGDSTRAEAGELQFGTMHASWGEGASHCGEDYGKRPENTPSEIRN